MASVQDRLYIDKSDRKIVETFEERSYFNFKNKTQKDKFIFAMCYGYNSGIKKMEIKKKEEFFFTKNLNSKDQTILYSIALEHTGDVNVLNDINKVYEIAQMYAHIGFKILSDLEESTSIGGSLESKFEIELKETYEKIQNKR